MKEDEKPVQHVELKISGDGSHTLYVPGLNEHYHSVFGAVAESNHIYINAGYKYLRERIQTVSILEIGFGTGLNALLTFLETIKDKGHVEYTAIEKRPLDEQVFSQLNYAEMIKMPGANEIFLQLHSSPWDQQIEMGRHFTLHKIHLAVEVYHPEPQSFDLIYFDAFGPDVQPELWSQEVFNKMAFSLKKGGVLVTYSTKGIVKRNLQEAGFSIHKLPGPAGKREILRATLP
jgi:tRNA U34 5-methylaminomethyl-2-thiouridine-forming methyltransferase MnmC